VFSQEVTMQGAREGRLIDIAHLLRRQSAWTKTYKVSSKSYVVPQRNPDSARSNGLTARLTGPVAL
jgi:hypothetical protein